MHKLTRWALIVALAVAGVSEASAFMVSIDARSLTNGEFLVPGQTGRMDGSVIQSVDLPEGTYKIQVGSARVGNFSFQVTASGNIDYSPAFDGFLQGRGSTTLVVRGYDVNFDATQLSTDRTFMLIIGSSAQDSTVVQPFTLVPDNGYKFTVGSGIAVDFSFNVNTDGTIDYSPVSDGFLSGRGSDTLIVNGHQVQIDATSLSQSDFRFPDAFGLRDNNLDSSVIQPLTLAPASYRFQVGAAQVSEMRWSVGADGAVHYDAAFDGYLRGRGTDTLIVDGHTVGVDVTALAGTGFRMPDTFGLRDSNMDSSMVQPLTLVPLQNGYRIQVGAANAGSFRWNVDGAGFITYDSAFDGFLAGRGTGTLRVDGYPVFLDATAMGSGLLQLFSVFGLSRMDAAMVQALTLAPTPKYEARFERSLRVPFMVGLDGLLAYDSSLDICVSGRGTSTLIIRCDPGDPPPPQQINADLQALIDSDGGDDLETLQVYRLTLSGTVTATWQAPSSTSWMPWYPRSRQPEWNRIRPSDRCSSRRLWTRSTTI